MPDRVALVTGATGSLGAAISHALAADGTSVVVADLLRDTSERAAAELQRHHGVACAGVALDVTDADSAAAAMREVGERFGALHAVVNCAGIQRQHAVAELPLADWERVLRTNLTGPFLVTQAALRAFWSDGAPGDASVVNIVSRSHLGGAKDASYTAAKGGLASLTLELAVELGPLGVRANGVSPSFVRSPLQEGRSDISDMAAFVARYEAITPLRRLVTPADVAATVAFLASERSRGITGQIIEVSAGSHLPAQP